MIWFRKPKSTEGLKLMEYEEEDDDDDDDDEEEDEEEGETEDSYIRT